MSEGTVSISVYLTGPVNTEIYFQAVPIVGTSLFPPALTCELIDNVHVDVVINSEVV